jgi:hypothetical protein
LREANTDPLLAPTVGGAGSSTCAFTHNPFFKTIFCFPVVFFAMAMLSCPAHPFYFQIIIVIFESVSLDFDFYCRGMSPTSMVQFESSGILHSLHFSTSQRKIEFVY